MSAGIITKGIGRAMVTQLTRVNRDPDYLLECLKQRDELIETLRARIRELQAAPGRVEATPAAPVEYISASAFARKNRCAVSTITRRFHAGKLAGKTDDHGHIFICADEVFAKYQKKRS